MVWIKKILQVKLNTYRVVLFEKRIIVLEAELEEVRRTAALDTIKHRVENKTIANSWNRKASCPVCCRYVKEARAAVLGYVHRGLE